MTEQYDETIAYHYAAYRPPLHQVILDKVLSASDLFEQGLDIGCGTGYSTVALARYCQHVCGVDPSQSMLEQATHRDNITYLEGAGEKIPLEDSTVDIVTFAGSLFYAERKSTVAELRRVCRPHVLVIPYDFEVLLDEFSEQLGIPTPKTMSDYDHTTNFSGTDGFIELAVELQQVHLDVSATELAHILLSDSHRYAAFSTKYKGANPFVALVDELGVGDDHSIAANIYFSKYRLR